MFPSEGLNYILNVVFGSEPKPSSIYIGLVVSTGFVGFSDSDTAASHSGWTEYTDYAESTRVQITFGAASGNSITNPTSITFTPSTSGVSVVGWFLTTAAAKSASTGVLIAQDTFDEGSTAVQAGIVQSFRLPVFSRNV